MAHLQQKKFCESVKNKFPNYFSNVKVLDCGSLDINGNNRYLFDNYQYLGLDLEYGPNVDVKCKIHEFNEEDSSYDVVISTECFEHDQFYKQSLNNMIRLLKSNGIMIFTCATTGRPEHGTKRSTPQDSPFTINKEDWCDYYKNLTEKDIRNCFDVELMFSTFEFSTGHETCDLYFWGIKK